MKKRPLVLTILALIHFAYPLFYLGQVIYFGNVSYKYLPGVLAEIYNPLQHPHFFYISIISPIIGYGLFRVRTWAFYLFLLNAVYSVGHNFYVIFFMYGFSEDPIKGVLRITGILISLVVVGYFIKREVRAPYFNPRMRWWESAPRYVVNLPISIANRGDAADAKIYDLSQSGAFVVSQGDFKLSEMIECSFQLKDDPVLTQGEIVWVSDGNGRHPKGIGVRFSNFGRVQQKMVKRFFKEHEVQLLDQR